MALLLGAGLLALASVNPAFAVLAAIYHLGLAALAGRDLARLPLRSGFSARRDLPRPLSLGTDEVLLVGVANPAAAGLAALVADHVPAVLRPRAREIAGTFDAGGNLVVEYGANPLRRGAFTLPALDLRCWRPGGYWMRQVRLNTLDEATVHPNLKAIRQYQLSARRGLPYRPGLRRSRPPGAATAFAGLRDYLPGDDSRRINWKATARRDQPVTVELEAERGQQVLVLLDCGRLMTAPAGNLSKLDQAVNAALLLAWLAQQQGDRVGLMAFSDRVEQYLAPARGPVQLSRLNELLYRVRAQPVEPDFGEAFTAARRRLTRRSLVVVLTDILDPTASAELVGQALWLGRRHLVLVVAITDPALAAARDAAVDRSERVYEWAAAEELLAARRQSFEALRRGGVLGLDVPGGDLSPVLVERYLELKERALL